MSVFRNRFSRLALAHCVLSLLVTMVFTGLNDRVHAQLIVGHRGASYDAPENTLAAFELAFEQGADGVEGDFRLTADNRIVCIHDDTTERVSNKNLVVAESRLEELRSIDVGSWKAKKFSDQRMPTLTEVINCIPRQKKFFIELKTGPEIVEPLKAVLSKAISEQLIELDQCVVISFKEKTILKCKELIPKLEAQWLTGFKELTDSSRNPPVWKPDADRILESMRSCQADGLGCQANSEAFGESTIRLLRDAGYERFHVWTVDDPKIALRYQSLGALGITTNRPRFIREQLKKKPAIQPGR